MTIINQTPLSMEELQKYIKKSEEKKPLDDYLKTFSKFSLDKVQKIKQEILALNNPKIRESDIAKVIDFAPQDGEDLNKIFFEVSLTEEEINKILEIVSK